MCSSDSSMVGPIRPVLAHVNSFPVLPFGTHSRREVVTLYGVADAQSLALALAATVESERLEDNRGGVVRHLGVWPDRGAMGDSAWRDDAGKLVTRDLDIPLATLELRAAELLGENGPTLRRVAAGLSMPDWPEGTDRALSFSLGTLVCHGRIGSGANTLGRRWRRALARHGARSRCVRLRHGGRLTDPALSESLRRAALHDPTGHPAAPGDPSCGRPHDWCRADGPNRKPVSDRRRHHLHRQRKGARLAGRQCAHVHELARHLFALRVAHDHQQVVLPRLARPAAGSCPPRETATPWARTLRRIGIEPQVLLALRTAHRPLEHRGAAVRTGARGARHGRCARVSCAAGVLRAVGAAISGVTFVEEAGAAAAACRTAVAPRAAPSRSSRIPRARAHGTPRRA